MKITFQRNIIYSTLFLIFLGFLSIHFGSKQDWIGFYHIDIAFVLLFASVLNLSNIHMAYEERIKAIRNKNIKHSLYGKFWIIPLSFMHIAFGMILLILSEIVSNTLVFCFDYLLGSILYDSFNFTLPYFTNVGLAYLIVFVVAIKTLSETPIQIQQFNQSLSKI